MLTLLLDAPGFDPGGGLTFNLRFRVAVREPGSDLFFG
jgi:hypothetical protein